MGHIQIRNVPPELHRKLKARAAEAGMSLSEYLLQGIERDAGRLTMKEWMARVESRPRAKLDKPPSAYIREVRDSS